MNQIAALAVAVRNSEALNGVERVVDKLDRQILFQNVNSSSFSRCFYTVNKFKDIVDPLYISGIFEEHLGIQEEVNFNFKFDSFSVNIYTEMQMSKWQLLCAYHVEIKNLIKVGDDIHIIKKTFKNVENWIIFKIKGVYYILPTVEIPIVEINKLSTLYEQKIKDKLETTRYYYKSCTFDQCMKLNNLSRCIHDLENTKDEVEYRIYLELQNVQNVLQRDDRIKLTSVSIKTNKSILEKKIDHNKYLVAKLNQLESQKLKKQTLLAESASISDRTHNRKVIQQVSDYLLRNQHLTLQIQEEKARIANIIHEIFPIETIRSHSSKVENQLFQTKFPNALTISYAAFKASFINGASSAANAPLIQTLSSLSKSHKERLNSLVGYIALIILTLSKILNLPLRYPIRYLGSNSYIHDPISSIKAAVQATTTSQTSDMYPLFTTHSPAVSVRFTYALLLLRKNLEQLFQFEKLAKAEDFNLLASIQIWLTCVSGYENINSEDFVENLGLSDLDIREEEHILMPQAIGHIRKISDNSLLSGNSIQSNTIKEHNIHIKEEERFNAIKRQLKIYKQ